jgi:hypothetical protein
MDGSEIYQPYLDRVIAAYAGEPYREELLRAKQQYFEETGDVHEDDAIYELRMACFFDWYLFDRPINGGLRSPVQRFFLEHRATMSAEEREVYQGFIDNIHSLFELKRRKPGFVVLEDLLGSEKRLVVERRERSALQKGDLFEARLIPYHGDLYFTRGFCFFPHPARRYLHGEAKRARKSGGDAPKELMRRLSYLRYLQERFRHVDVKRIYSEQGLALARDGATPKI